MIKTEFHYTTEEIRDFFTFHLMIKDKTRFIYYLTSLASVLLGALFVFVIHYVVFGFILIVAAIGLMLWFPFQVKRVIEKNVSSKYKRPKQDIIFEVDHITQYQELRTVTYQWNQIIEVNETSRYLYLYISKMSALIVNKQTTPEATVSDLIALMKDKGIAITVYKNK